jgi:hypothetical protein
MHVLFSSFGKLTLFWMHLTIYDADPIQIERCGGTSRRAGVQGVQGVEAPNKLGRLSGGEAPTCQTMKSRKKIPNEAVEYENAYR